MPKPLKICPAILPIFPVPISPTVLPCMSQPTSPSRVKFMSCTRARARHLAIERHEQRHRVFCDGIRGVGRHPGDEDVVIGRGLQIDVVEARAAHGDDAHPGLRQPSITGRVGLSLTKAQTPVTSCTNGRVSSFSRKS